MTNEQQASQWNIKRLLDWTSDYFDKTEIDRGRLCAEILLSHVLGFQRIELYTRFDYYPNPEELAGFRALVKRAVEHEPIGYLTNKAYFYSMEFEVAPGVLIPRPETETLVTEAIDFLRNNHNRPIADVLELGVGSGCIAIAVAANVIETEVIAVDISPTAIETATRNIATHELDGRITLLQSDLFNSVESAGKGLFDLILSNPPYISDTEFTKLKPNVRDHEPHKALKAGENGLEYYRRIIADADKFLADDGVLMVEVGYDQAAAVSEIFESGQYLRDIVAVTDSLGHKRVVKGRKI